MNSHQPQEREDQIDLLVFVKIIWDRKIIISLLTLVLAISSVLYALSIPNIFESRVVLAPSSSSESTNINLSGTAGALARVAGIDLGGGGSSKGPNLTLAIEKITSRKFAKCCPMSTHASIQRVVYTFTLATHHYLITYHQRVFVVIALQA